MEFSLFYCKLSRGYGLRTSKGITDSSCVIRTFEADSYESALFICPEIREDLLRKNRIPVILIEYLEEPTYTTVINELSEFKRIVGGAIDIVECPDLPEIDIICNDEGKLLKLPLNRALTDGSDAYDVVAGNMILADTDLEGNTIGLSKSKISAAYEHFKLPELFVLDDAKNDLEVINCSYEMGRLMKINFIPNVSLK